MDFGNWHCTSPAAFSFPFFFETRLVLGEMVARTRTCAQKTAAKNKKKDSDALMLWNSFFVMFLIACLQDQPLPPPPPPPTPTPPPSPPPAPAQASPAPPTGRPVRKGILKPSGAPMTPKPQRKKAGWFLYITCLFHETFGDRWWFQFWTFYLDFWWRLSKMTSTIVHLDGSTTN